MNYFSLIIIRTLMPLLWFAMWQCNESNNWSVENTKPLNSDDNEPDMSTFTIDTAVLTKLAQDVPHEMMPKLIDAFLKELDTRFTIIAEHPLRGNEEQIRLQAHSVKSCARTFGAHDLGELAAEIEMLAEQRNATAEPKIVHLLALLPTVKQAFVEYKMGLGRG
ncbi:MAG: Hpt domain-containing protein [Psychrosphaera sp.]|nr:Hpt domain-containing protein [Psychrosphaera sp.]